MIFSTPEREFLRLSAMSSPDWPAMITIARTALHYGELRRLALLHQLDGVVAWRLLDERMDGIAPNIVRDDCQRYMDWVDGFNRAYWSDVGAFVAAANKLGIRYAMRGGPAQYAPLGIIHWPRSWTGIDVDMDITKESDIAALVQDLKATSKSYEPRNWDLVLPSGMRLDITAYPLDESLLFEGITWTPWDMPLVPITVLGLNSYVPDPAIYVPQLAVGTWVAVAKLSAPLSLWAISRLAAWMDHPAFDMTALDKLLSTNIAAKRGMLRGSRPCPADSILWLLAIAHRVYGTPLPEVTGVEPDVYTMQADGYAGDGLTGYELVIDQAVLSRMTSYYYLVRHFRWNWPGDEQMIFDHRLDQPIEGRIASGVWQEVDDLKGSDHFRIDMGNGQKHWGETFQRDITHG